MVQHQRTEEVQVILPGSKVLSEVLNLLMELFPMVHILISEVVPGLENSPVVALELGLVENLEMEVDLLLVDILQVFCLPSNLKEHGLPDNQQVEVELGLAVSNLEMEAEHGQARYNLDLEVDLDAGQVEIVEVPLVCKEVVIVEDVVGIIIVTVIAVEEIMYQHRDCVVK